MEIESTLYTGADYTIAPANLRKNLVPPINKMSLVPTVERRVEMDTGRVMAAGDGRTEAALMLFEEDESRNLPGPTGSRGCA